VVVDGDDIVVATVDGVVRRHSRVDGEPRWQKSLGRQLDASLVVQANGEIIVTGLDSEARRFFVGIDQDGNERWRNDIAFRESTGNSYEPDVGSADAAIAGDGWVLYGSLGGIAALLPSHHLTDLPLSVGAPSLGVVPLAQQGFLIAHSTGLMALGADRSVRWSREGLVATSQPVVSSSGVIYFGDAQGGFHAYSAAGERLWTSEAGSPVTQSAVLAADGTIYFATATGNVHALTPEGSLLWRFEIGEPVRASLALLPSGQVVVATTSGRILALAGNSPLASTGWPKRHGDATHSGRIVAAGVDRLWLLDENGNVLSESPSGRSPQNDPVLGADGSIYIDSQVPTPQLNLVWPEAQRLVPLTTSLKGGAFQIAVLVDGGFVLQESGRVHSYDGYGVRTRMPTLPGAWAVLGDGDVLRIGAKLIQRFTRAGVLKWEKPFALEVPIGVMLAVDSLDGVYGATRADEAFALNSEGELRWKSEPIPNLPPSLPLLDAAGNLWFCGFWTVDVNPEGQLLDSLYLGSRVTVLTFARQLRELTRDAAFSTPTLSGTLVSGLELGECLRRFSYECDTGSTF